MYSLKNVDIMKEVDSFIAQAKLEGDISGSSSSNLSINVLSASTAIKEDQILEQKSESKIETEIPPCKETARCNDSETDVRIDNSNPTLNCFIENEKQDFLTKKSPTYDINLTTNIDTNIKIPKRENNRMKSGKASQNNVTSPQNLKINWDWKYGKTNSSREDEDSCGSSFVDLASDSNKSKISYVMWLQERRSKQQLLHTLPLDEQSEKKHFESDKVHLHQVNSALFWERWLDNIFQLYDQWVNSSESEDDSNVSKKSYSSINSKDKRPIKTRSEPTLRTQSEETMKVNNLKYKCPSYVDWLVQRRQEKMELTDSEEVIEPKKYTYWSSLYGKLTKSLSSIFLTVTKSPKEEINLQNDEPETEPLVSKSPSGSPRAVSRGLRRSHSYACSHSQHDFCHATNRRFRHLSQDSVGSPVLTDQLVELVCKTLSPDSSSSDSTSQEDVRKRKPYRRLSKRKS